MMTSDQERAADTPDRPLTREDASRLLLVGIERRDRPVDHVISRLGEPDGAAWLHEAVKSITGVPLWSSSEAAADPPTLKTLCAGKTRAKAAMALAQTIDDVAAATAAYLISIAAAGVHHDACISRRPREELVEMLAELAAVAPPPWAGLLRDASVKLE